MRRRIRYKNSSLQKLRISAPDNLIPLGCCTLSLTPTHTCNTRIMQEEAEAAAKDAASKDQSAHPPLSKAAAAAAAHKAAAAAALELDEKVGWGGSHFLFGSHLAKKWSWHGARVRGKSGYCCWVMGGQA